MTNELKHRSGFKVPEGYFEKSKSNIRELVKEDSRDTLKQKESFNFSYMIAASIVLLMVSVFVLLPSDKTKENNHAVTIQLADIDYYDINMNDLYYAYNDENIEFESESIETSDLETINYIADELSIDEIILLSENE